MKKCPECGKNAKDDDVFCQNCGNSFGLFGELKQKKKKEIDLMKLLSDKKTIIALILLTVLTITASSYIMFVHAPSDTPVCGDKICEGEETVSSCPEDCRVSVKKNLAEFCYADAECSSSNCCFSMCALAEAGCAELRNQCSENIDCGTGEICIDTKCLKRQCYLDSDCEGGYSCVGGLCIEEKKCASIADCNAGEECIYGRCVKKSCSRNSDCAKDEKCYKRQCVKKCGDKICQPGEELSCRSDCLGKKFALDLSSVCSKNSCKVEVLTSLDEEKIEEIEWFYDEEHVTGGTEDEYEFENYGDHEITVIVTDTDGDNEIIIIDVVTENQPPVPVITATPAGPEYKAGETITFSSEGSYDPDGADIILTENKGWTIEKESGEVLLKSDKKDSISYKFKEEGRYLVLLRITDNDPKEPKTGASQRKIQIGENKPPANIVISIKHAEGYGGKTDQYYKGEALLFSATAVDPDGDSAKLSYEWDFGDGTTITGQETEHAYQDSKQYTLNLKVTDEYGFFSTKTQSMVINNNNPPDISLLDVSISPYPIFTKKETTFEIIKEAVDPESHPVRYEWWYSDSKVASGKVYKEIFPTSGNYEIIIRAIDSLGAASEKKIKEYVIYGGPVGVGFDANQYSITEGGSVNFIAKTATDPDGGSVTYAWDFSNDGQFKDATGKEVSKVFTSAGTFPVSLKATDDEGEYTISAPQNIEVLPLGGLKNSDPISVILYPLTNCRFSTWKTKFEIGAETRGYSGVQWLTGDIKSYSGTYGWKNHYPYLFFTGGGLSEGYIQIGMTDASVPCDMYSPILLDIKKIVYKNAPLYGTDDSLADFIIYPENMKYCWPGPDGTCKDPAYKPYNYELVITDSTSTTNNALFLNLGPAQIRGIYYKTCSLMENKKMSMPDCQKNFVYDAKGGTTYDCWSTGEGDGNYYLVNCPNSVYGDTRDPGTAFPVYFNKINDKPSAVILTSLLYMISGAKGTYYYTAEISGEEPIYCWPDSDGFCLPGAKPYNFNPVAFKEATCVNDVVTAQVKIHNKGPQLTGIKYRLCTESIGCEAYKYKYVSIDTNEKEYVPFQSSMVCAAGDDIKLQISGVEYKQPYMSNPKEVSIINYGEFYRYCWQYSKGGKEGPCPDDHIRVNGGTA